MTQPYDPFREYLEGEVAMVPPEEMDDADGVAVGVTIDPEHPEHGPVLLLSFFDKEKHVRSVRLIGNHANLSQLIADAVAQRERVTAEVIEKLLANLADRIASGDVHEDQLQMVHARGKVHCPKCNRRLFGEIARRGGCMSCYPEVPLGGKVLSSDPDAGPAR